MAFFAWNQIDMPTFKFLAKSFSANRLLFFKKVKQTQNVLQFTKNLETDTVMRCSMIFEMCSYVTTLTNQAD